MSVHTLSVLVENKPGVLARIAGLFSRRGFNIDSLAVGPTEHPEISRMTIVVNVDESVWNGGRRGLYRVHGRRIEWRSGPLQHLFRHAEILRGQREAHIDLFDGAHFGARNDDITCRLSR